MCVWPFGPLFFFVDVNIRQTNVDPYNQNTVMCCMAR